MPIPISTKANQIACVSTPSIRGGVPRILSIGDTDQASDSRTITKNPRRNLPVTVRVKIHIACMAGENAFQHVPMIAVTANTNNFGRVKLMPDIGKNATEPRASPLNRAIRSHECRI